MGPDWYTHLNLFNTGCFFSTVDNILVKVFEINEKIAMKMLR